MIKIDGVNIGKVYYKDNAGAVNEIAKVDLQDNGRINIWSSGPDLTQVISSTIDDKSTSMSFYPHWADYILVVRTSTGKEWTKPVGSTTVRFMGRRPVPEPLPAGTTITVHWNGKLISERRVVRAGTA